MGTVNVFDLIDHSWAQVVQKRKRSEGTAHAAACAWTSPAVPHSQQLCMAAAAAAQQLRADLAAAGFDIDSATLATATSADEAPPRWPTTAHTPGIPIWHNMTLEQKRAFVASMGEDPDQIPTLETFEFGSLQWNEYASSLGVRLLTEAMQDNRLTVDGLVWGFSEEYTCTPDRLMDDQRELSGYYLQISGGRISGGAGVPPSCLALEGFHGHAVIP
jgi:hypothetical protein